MPPLNRPRAVLALSVLALLTAALAGCTTSPGDASPDGDGDGGDAGNGANGGDGGTGGGDEEPSFEPAPTGSELTSSEIAAFAAAFSDEPLTGGQEPWPSHRLKWVTNDTFLLLHFDHEDPLQAERLLWMGLGVRGVFCAEDRPGPEFTHFHQRSAPTYAEGHGGQAGDEGYWLAHVNVRAFDSPFGPTGRPGVHEQFGPTPPEDCGEAYEPATFDPPGSDPLDTLEMSALHLAFDDQPLRGGQEPWPAHRLKWVTPEVFTLLHFDNDDPSQATELLWAGIGVRGTFCADDRPGPEFSHFHSSHAPTYAEGHGGQPMEPGYWLMHMNVKEFDSPFGPTGRPGVHERFGPTPPPEC